MKKAISDFLESHTCKFRWIDKETVGLYIPEKDEVYINLYLLIAETLLHEFLHFQYPYLGEVEIEAKTRKKVKNMKVDEIRELVDYLIAFKED